MLEVLVEKHWDIDLSLVDYEASADLIIQHLDEDSAVLGSLEEIRLSEMRGLLRAVYLNQAPIFCMEDLEEVMRVARGLTLMALSGDSNVLYDSDDEVRTRSRKQIKREDMVLAVDQLKEGMWLMIYDRNQPKTVVQITSVPPGGRVVKCREWGKTLGVKQSGWIDEGVLFAVDLGILPDAQGFWETTGWAEILDDQIFEM